MALRRYAFSESTIVSFDQYELTLRDDHTFELSCGSSDPAGWMGGETFRGTWMQSGDELALTSKQRETSLDEQPSAKTYAARFVGADVEIDGIGRFQPFTRT